MGRIDLTGRVVIVTGAGAGLGRAHALLLARRGARVLVNDLEGADAVVAEIRAAGGEACAAIGSVTDEAFVSQTVANTLEAWGRIDALVLNAGILRDKSFGKMTLADFRLLLDVHVMGAVLWIHAAWDTMRRQRYGRIVLTTSSSGLYGSFGQANYAAAKMALVGLMQTLALEGRKYDIRVNCLAPTAATRMLEGILPDAQQARLRPERVSPAVLALLAEDAPSRAILGAGAGSFELAHVTLTRGIHLPEGETSAEAILDQWSALADRNGEQVPAYGLAQAELELAKAGLAPGG